MNNKKINRVVRDLASLSIPEIYAVLGQLMLDHDGDVVKNIIDTVNSAHQSEVSTALARRSNSEPPQIRLVDKGEKAIAVIKAVRECYGSWKAPGSDEIEYCTLKVAKAIVDAAPITITQEINPHLTVHEVKLRLEAAGATVKVV